MNQKKHKRKIYEAVGFVEALIAIAVAGIASLVLMSIAATTIAQVLRNEVSDQMTQAAIEGAEMAKKIADNQNLSGGTLFPEIEGNINSCFAFRGDTNSPEFVKNGESFSRVCNYDGDGRDDCKGAVLESDDEFFRVLCITPESDPALNLVVTKTIVGLVDCDSVVANSKCEITDYEYYSAIKVTQSED